MRRAIAPYGKTLPLRENIVARRWVIASEGTVKWRDVWASGRES